MTTSPPDETIFDAIVIGGGPAGLSGATALARFRRSVLVVDAGTPRNAVAGHVHNVFTRDGATPSELSAAGRAEVESYGGVVVEGEVLRVTRAGTEPTASFRVELADGTSYVAGRLLVTTGAVDELPTLPGVAELWGRDVLHCPYCHGWEVRDRAVGILATSPLAGHVAQMFRQLTDDVIVFSHGQDLAAADRSALDARGIRVIDAEVTALDVLDGRLAGVRLATGETVPRDAVAVSPRVTARAGFLSTLGVEVVEQEMGGISIGTSVLTDPTGATSVPRVWAAGNVADIRAQVITSAAAGLWAAASLNADLIGAEVAAAVARTAQR